MNTMVSYHAVKMRAPFYKKEAGTQLHRYLIPEFVSRFQQDLQDHLLGSEPAMAWQSQDRFSKHDNHLVLRLPMHKTFYLVSCEVVCDRLGTPALDAKKITSAGFVIRRIVDGKEQSWMLENDEPVGWEESSTGLRDPDVHRRMCRDGSLHPRENVPTYTGEKAHPLHKEKSYDQDGKCHTILYGYLPLGGTYVHQANKNKAIFDAASLQEFTDATGKHLSWPYGLKEPLNRQWRSQHSRPVQQGKPTQAFFELIRLLVNRYHLGESGIDENSAIKELSKSLYFYRHHLSMIDNFSDNNRSGFNNLRKYSLYSWLKNNFSQEKNPLIPWLDTQEKGLAAALKTHTTFELTPLPAKNNSGAMNYSLYVTPSDAREFRSLLGQRVMDNALSLAKEIPMPKFQQSKRDLYQIVPFVRLKYDNGKERIVWCDSSTRSELFRVAAPFDANAARASVIQMPSLGDLRNGLAKGASMITPPDTFSLLNALNLKKGASEDVLPDPPPEGGMGIQWICSFSLPVITLVAMILLMIMISLLNIIFFWLPWVKICLPFPKIK
jgi:hypothetical protein